MSTEAALQYYEGLGQNWERAALIKARAGGRRSSPPARPSSPSSTPYIWRKYLDYAAIADIHSIKRQIHDHRGHGEIAVAGHNIKLGRGGIREIEFFVQTQQLIAGGRNPELRGRATLDDARRALADARLDRPPARDELSRAYRVPAPRRALPADGRRRADAYAARGRRRRSPHRAHGGLLPMPPPSPKALTATLRTVRDHYAALFETAPTLTSRRRQPRLHRRCRRSRDARDACAPRLRAPGRRHAAPSAAGISAATPRCARPSARERLTEIHAGAARGARPDTDNADAAFAAFDRFLAAPAGRRPALLAAQLQPGSARADRRRSWARRRGSPRPSSQRAHVLDALIEPGLLRQRARQRRIAERLANSLAEADAYEDVLDRARIFGQEQKFLIGVRVLAGTIGPRQAGRAYRRSRRTS